MIRRTAGVVTCIALTSLLFGCSRGPTELEIRLEVQRLVDELSDEVHQEYREVLFLGAALGLEWTGWPNTSVHTIVGSGASEVTLVESEEIALTGHPNVFHFWPGELTPKILACWNTVFADNQQELREHGLQFPLSIEQLFARPTILNDLRDASAFMEIDLSNSSGFHMRDAMLSACNTRTHEFETTEWP